MSGSCPPEFLDLAHELADASGEVIRGYYRAHAPVDRKADDSPVTAADRDAERAIREILSRRRPDDGIVGEEFGDERPGAELVWVIDPIDGTSSFISGRPLFGTLIAAVRAGAPVLGVIDQPVSRERWSARRGGGATLNGAPARVRRRGRLGDGVLATTSPDLFAGAAAGRFRAVARAAGQTVYGGDCYNYGLLASGFVDAVVESGLEPFDFCALAPVIEEAGGRITDWAGRPLGLSSGGDVAAAGDARLHAELLVLLNGGEAA